MFAHKFYAELFRVGVWRNVLTDADADNVEDKVALKTG